MKHKRKSRYDYAQPDPSQDYPLGGFVPGYTEQICPKCRFPFCGGKGCTECKRCALTAQEKLKEQR